MKIYSISITNFLHQMNFLGSKREIKTLLQQRGLTVHLPLTTGDFIPYKLSEDIWVMFNESYECLGMATGSRSDIPEQVSVIDFIPDRDYIVTSPK